MTRGAWTIDTTPTFKAGDPAPDGYLDRHEWAQVQLRAGLRQSRCRKCMLWLFPQQHKDHKCKGKS